MLPRRCCRSAGGNVRYTRRLPNISLGTALAIVVTACGGGGSGGASAPTTRLKETPSATAIQINKQPRDRVKDGGTLTWPLDDIPANFNIMQVDGSLVDNATVVNALLPAPFLFDETATPRFNPDYLVAEPVVTTEPKQVVKYEINPKARWDDGTPITWEDFHWVWASSNGKNEAYQIAASNGYSQIESVERGADDREVVVTFAQPYADWQNLFSPLMPASTTRDPKIF